MMLPSPWKAGGSPEKGSVPWFRAVVGLEAECRVSIPLAVSQRVPVSASWSDSGLQVCFASFWDAMREGADGSGGSCGGVGSLIKMVQSPALIYLDPRCCRVLQGEDEQESPGISVQIWANLGVHICVPRPGGGEPRSSSLPDLPRVPFRLCA